MKFLTFILTLAGLGFSQISTCQLPLTTVSDTFSYVPICKNGVTHKIVSTVLTGDGTGTVTSVSGTNGVAVASPTTTPIIRIDSNSATTIYGGGRVKRPLRADSNLTLSQKLLLTSVISPAATFSAAAGTAGSLTGAYYWAIAYATDSAETPVSQGVGPVTVTSKRVNLTAIPVSTSARVTARKIYRTVAGWGEPNTFRYVGTIANNTTTTFTDSIADASLGATGPEINTTGGATFVNGVRALALGGFSTQINTGDCTNSGYADTYLGAHSGCATTSGRRNTASGVDALQHLKSAEEITAMGVHAGDADTGGSACNFIGYAAGFGNKYCFNSVFDGPNTSTASAESLFNVTCVGGQSCVSNKASNLTAGGAFAFQDNVSGIGNAGWGRSIFTHSTSNFNAGIGDGSAGTQTTGAGTTVTGSDAYTNGNGDVNTISGAHAGNGLDTGDGTVELGAYTGQFYNASGGILVGTTAGYYETTDPGILMFDSFLRSNKGTSRLSSILWGQMFENPASQFLSLGGAGGKVSVGVGGIPSYPLHVKGAGTGNYKVLGIEGTNAVGTGLHFETATGINWSLISAGSSASQGAGSFLFYRDDSDGSSATEAFHPNGNISVGTAVDSGFKFDINGNFRARGSVTTAAPSGGSAAAWKLGDYIGATTCTLDATKYITIQVGATALKVATCL